MTPVVILGAGAVGREVHDVLLAINGTGTPTYEFRGFLADDISEPHFLAERKADYLGTIDELAKLDPDVQYLIAMGSGADRRRVWERVQDRKRTSPTLLHPQNAHSPFAGSIAEGSTVYTYCAIDTNATVGRHTQVFGYSSIGHDSCIGDCVTLYVGTRVSGNVVIEDDVEVGTGAVILPGITIGKGVRIGAGAVVTGDVPAGATVVGVPAKPLRT